MVRMRSYEGFAGSRPRKSSVTVHFIGPLGHGVGLAADILEHIAQAATHAVVRDRRVAVGSAGETPRQDGLLHVVRMEAAAAGHRAAAIAESAEIIVAWSAEAALAFAHLLKSPSDFYVVHEGHVPTWRRDLNCAVRDGAASLAVDDRRSDDRQTGGVISAVRALGMISRRLPFDDGLWETIVAQHVPAALREAAMHNFAAAAW
ncbi:MAG: hypothetical protein JNK76_06105 [Planctomycetales bacterium]|nr:hypothetical protein [Planctomycetales bacterium]MBN8624090.1 hypothetical protein [Planctomycetota bacterium]